MFCELLRQTSSAIATALNFGDPPQIGAIHLKTSLSLLTCNLIAAAITGTVAEHITA